MRNVSKCNHRRRTRVEACPVERFLRISAFMADEFDKLRREIAGGTRANKPQRPDIGRREGFSPGAAAIRNWQDICDSHRVEYRARDLGN